MLSRAEAAPLAELLASLSEALPGESRIALAREMPAALKALEAYARGRELDRRAVAVAVTIIEMELRRIARSGEARAPELEKLWSQVDELAERL